MRAIVLSDSHHSWNSIMDIIETEKAFGIDMIIHAGDVHRDVEDMIDAYPMFHYEYVLGNNDFYTVGVPFDRIFSFGGHKIFLTHGHNYGVKRTLARLSTRGRELGAEICIFGHTHMQYLENTGAPVLLNPGAASRGYAVLTDCRGELNITLKER